MKQTIEKIQFEIEEINRLLQSYAFLINHCMNKTPDLLELAAIATILHSFYNGIEKVFVLIAKEIDQDLPKEYDWHKKLLIQMSKLNNKRNSVISQEMLNTLNEYLAFRHFFRHSYSFHLSWNKIEDMATRINLVWRDLKLELDKFLKTEN